MNEQEIIAQALAKGETVCPQGVSPATWEMSKGMYYAQQQSQIAAAQSQMNGVQVANVPATVGTGSVPAPATLGGSLGSLDLDDVAPSGLTGVNGYLKVSSGTTKIGDEQINNEVLKVKIDMSMVAKKFSIKSNGNPPVYVSSYDGKTCTDGTSWVEGQQKVQRIQPDAKPYISYDIPMQLLEPAFALTVVNGVPTQKIIMDKGSIIGHTTPTTGRKNFESLLRELLSAGKIPSKEIVYVDVKRQDIDKNGRKWAIVSFELMNPEEAAKYTIV